MQDKKKKIKIIAFVLLSVTVVGIIIGCFVDWSFPTWIYFSGSSTIQPLVQQISNIYQKSEIIADAGGSSTGISNLVNKHKDIGMISKTPDVSVAGLPADSGQQIEGKYQSSWISEQIKTFTIAYDAIGVIYKSNYDINLTNENILKFYEIFSGNSLISLKQLMPNLNVGENVCFLPFARTGGAELSGTAEAFLKNSGFTNASNIPQNIYNILETGNYGKNLIQTAESNLQTWNIIKDFSGDKNLIPITYLSGSFIVNNYQNIIDSGFKIALYNSQSLYDIQNDHINIDNGYNWYRPLNFLVRLENIKEDLKTFIDWYFEQTIFSKKENDLKKIIKKLGFCLLNEEQYTTMTINGNFYVSDYQLISKQKEERKKLNIWYGAYNSMQLNPFIVKEKYEQGK